MKMTHCLARVDDLVGDRVGDRVDDRVDDRVGAGHCK